VPTLHIGALRSRPVISNALKELAIHILSRPLENAACVHYIGHVARIQTTSEFNDWFGSLRDKQGRQRISVRITRLAQGNPGQHRSLGGGLQELKIDFGPGYRVYFTERAGITYILLCGGDKDSQSRDIERARELASRL